MFGSQSPTRALVRTAGLLLATGTLLCVANQARAALRAPEQSGDPNQRARVLFVVHDLPRGELIDALGLRLPDVALLDDWGPASNSATADRRRFISVAVTAEGDILLTIITDQEKAYLRRFEAEDSRVIASHITSFYLAIDAGQVRAAPTAVALPESGNAEQVEVAETKAQQAAGIEDPFTLASNETQRPTPATPETGAEPVETAPKPTPEVKPRRRSRTKRPPRPQSNPRPPTTWNHELGLRIGGIINLPLPIPYGDAGAPAGGGLGGQFRYTARASNALLLAGGLSMQRDAHLDSIVWQSRATLAAGYLVTAKKTQLALLPQVGAGFWWYIAEYELDAKGDDLTHALLLAGLQTSISWPVPLPTAKLDQLRLGFYLDVNYGAVISAGSLRIPVIAESGEGRHRLGGLELAFGIELGLGLRKKTQGENRRRARGSG